VGAVVKRPGPRLTQALLLGLAIVAFAGLGAIYLWRYRRGQPVDIDEAGYLLIAINDYRGLEDGGAGGWWDAMLAPGIQAPLMPALTVPVFLVTGPGVLPGLLVALAFGAVLLVASYALGSEIGGSRLGWLTLALTAAVPVIIMFHRSYLFPIPSAACSALMLWTIVRSRGFVHTQWSVAAGACIGLVALSRTLTLAFLPALVIVGLLLLAVGPSRGRRLLNLVLAVAVSLVVAGPWYRRNGEAVWDYLTDYGYGAGRSAYGEDQSLLSSDTWRESARYVIATSGLPVVVLWVVGAAVLVWACARVWRRDGARRTVLATIRSPLLPSAVWAAWGLVMLTSSGNKGTGFTTPLIPAMALLTAWAFLRLPRVPARALVAASLAVLVLNTAAAADPSSSLAKPRVAQLPWIGHAVWVNGAGSIQNYIRAGQLNPGTGQLTRRQGEAWHRANRRLTELLYGLGPAFVVFGFRHRLINVNTVQLEQRLAGRDPIPITMVDPIAVPNDEQLMADYLSTGPAATSCLVLTAGGLAYEIEPIVDPDLMAAAARHSGFVRLTTIELPDRRSVVVWRRPATCPVTDTPVPAA
jgi:4-amino-4-deoxy-L-arabinose transferase-like glycosyltransferase